jgi:hypothetical protein
MLVYRVRLRKEGWVSSIRRVARRAGEFTETWFRESLV